MTLLGALEPFPRAPSSHPSVATVAVVAVAPRWVTVDNRTDKDSAQPVSVREEVRTSCGGAAHEEHQAARATARGEASSREDGGDLVRDEWCE